jgi:hypothetical protein
LQEPVRTAASTTIDLPAVVDWAAAGPAADEEQPPDRTKMAEQAAPDAARGKELPAPDNWAAAAPAGGTTMAELAAADSEGGGAPAAGGSAQPGPELQGPC